MQLRSSGAPGSAVSDRNSGSCLVISPSSVYGTQEDLSMWSTIAGFGVSLVSFEKCGNRPMLTDQALKPISQENRGKGEGSLLNALTGLKRMHPRMWRT